MHCAGTQLCLPGSPAVEGARLTFSFKGLVVVNGGPSATLDPLMLTRAVKLRKLSVSIDQR